jgi:predicted transcriptional regulator
MGQLTRDQVFNTIVEYKRQHNGLSPSLKEIAAAVQLSVSTVRYHLLMLDKEGRIHITGRWGIEVPGGNWDWEEV